MTLAIYLNSLLRLRKNQEKLVQKEFSEINRHLIGQQKSLELLKEAEQNNRREFDKRQDKNIDINTQIIFDDYFIGLKRQQRFQQKVITDTNFEWERKHKKLVSAVIARKSLEILNNRNSLRAKIRAKQQKTNYIEEDTTLWRGHF